MGIFSKLFGGKKTTEYEKDFDESVFMASHQLADGAQREKFISHTLEQMKEAEGITEQLKEQDRLEWVQRMGNIQHRATKIVYDELIYV